MSTRQLASRTVAFELRRALARHVRVGVQLSRTQVQAVDLLELQAGRLEGITLSRLDGRIVEDWSGFDSFALLRQLGLRRSLIAARRMLRAFRDARAS